MLDVALTHALDKPAATDSAGASPAANNYAKLYRLDEILRFSNGSPHVTKLY